MKQWVSHLCSDAGTEYCPCYLAEVGRCVNCGLLSGLDTCQCEWTGSCIYSEYNWNMSTSRSPRVSVPADVISHVDIGYQATAISLELPGWMARNLGAPGSFLFLRPLTSPSYFETPLSVMQVQGHVVHLAIQKTGPKTQAVLDATRLSVRGPFHSGIIGLSNVKIPSARALILGKGICQGRAVHTANYLARRGVSITLALGPGTTGDIFGHRWLDDVPVTLLQLDKKDDHNRSDLASMIASEHWDLAVSAGSDRQHKMVYEVATGINPGLRLAFTNNALMCCGEGICGACGSLTGDHKARSCKAMPDTEDLVFLTKAGGND